MKLNISPQTKQVTNSRKPVPAARKAFSKSSQESFNSRPKMAFKSFFLIRKPLANLQYNLYRRGLFLPII